MLCVDRHRLEPGSFFLGLLQCALVLSGLFGLVLDSSGLLGFLRLKALRFSRLVALSLFGF